MEKNRTELKTVKSKKADKESEVLVYLYHDVELDTCTHFTDIEKGYINLHLTIKAMDAERQRLENPLKEETKALGDALKNIDPAKLAEVKKLLGLA